VCVLISSTFVWNIFHCKWNWVRYDRKCLLVFVLSTLYWSSCKVPFIGIRVKYPLLVFVWSTLYWYSCEVPFIVPRVKYPLLVFCEVPFIGPRVKYLYLYSCEVPFIGPRVKYPSLVFVWSTLYCSETLIYSTVFFFFFLKYQISWKIRPVRAELFHADRQTEARTDMRKLIVAFRKFCERTWKY
jgi:hypothetical protein